MEIEHTESTRRDDVALGCVCGSCASLCEGRDLKTIRRSLMCVGARTRRVICALRLSVCLFVCPAGPFPPRLSASGARVWCSCSGGVCLRNA